jgi:hypothetical protein
MVKEEDGSIETVAPDKRDNLAEVRKPEPVPMMMLPESSTSASNVQFLRAGITI